MTNRTLRRGLLTVAVLAGAASASAAQCGSALLLETEAPAALDGVDLLAPGVVRFWEAGAAGTNRSDDGCQAGCTAATGPLCLSGGDCIALTGVSWLNASCAAPGHLPLRTVFLLEQTTADSGGRWAAINLSHNADDANTDLDAKAAAARGGCASVVSLYLGGDGLLGLAMIRPHERHLGAKLVNHARFMRSLHFAIGLCLLALVGLHFHWIDGLAVSSVATSRVRRTRFMLLVTPMQPGAARRPVLHRALS